MGKYFGFSLVILILVACQTVTPTNEEATPTFSSIQPNYVTSTIIKEPKHPKEEPRFTVSPTRTHAPTPIPERKGYFSLIFTQDPIPEAAHFDFDFGGFNPVLQENDVVAGLAIGTDVFLVILPFGEALQLTVNNEGRFEFDHEICDGYFGRGGIPINPELYYCFRTNEGRLALFKVANIEKGDLKNGWRVNFTYVLWAQ